jgi:excisionase family DNA binding protein
VCSGRGTVRAPGDRVPTRSVLVDHAAEILGVSRRTVYYRIGEGKLRTIRTRCGSQRVLVESIEALLREKMARVKQRRSKNDVSTAGAPVAAADRATGGDADVSDRGLFARSRVLWQPR